MTQKTGMGKEKTGNWLQTLVGLLVVVVLVLSLYGHPEWIPIAVQVFTILFTSAVFSAVAEALLEGITGDALKVITIPIEIFGFNFSVTAFAIAAIVVKLWLFGGI